MMDVEIIRVVSCHGRGRVMARGGLKYEHATMFLN